MSRKKNYKRFPSHFADNQKITETLIENGADMTIRNDDGENVIGMAMDMVTKGMAVVWLGSRRFASKLFQF